MSRAGFPRIRTPRLVELTLGNAGLVEIDAPELAHLQINGLSRLRGVSPFTKVEGLSVTEWHSMSQDDENWKGQIPSLRIYEVIQQCPNVRKLAIDHLHDNFRFHADIVLQDLEGLEDLVLKSHEYLGPLLTKSSLRLPNLRHLHVGAYSDIFGKADVPVSMGDSPGPLASLAVEGPFPQLQSITLYGSIGLSGDVLCSLVSFLREYRHVELVTK